MVGAEVLIVSKPATGGGTASLFAKLIRVETGGILAVSKVDIIGGGIS